VAVLLVLGRHGEGPRIWKNAGWVGVDLFFVLSGFLISGLLFSEYKKTGSINWGRFFIRRGFKIYPAFYAMLFATFLWQVAKHQEIPWRSYLPEVFFYQNYQGDHVWNHTWSLAVEEHFYILLPLLLVLMLGLKRKGNNPDPFRMIPIGCLVLAVGCLLERLHLTLTLPTLQISWSSILFPSHLRIDSLFFGVLLGYLHHFHPSALIRITSMWWSRLILLLASALLVSTCLFYAVDSPFMLSFGLTALYIGFGGILVLALYWNSEKPSRLPLWLNKFKVWDLAAFIGMYSYSIYLWHSIVSQHYQGFLRLFWPTINESALFWGYVLISLAVGIVLARTIEYPALNLRDRIFPSKQSVKGSQAGSSFQFVVADVEESE
jgi:peptidoglycan/LPS O-acetylase OafA/YrhL